MTKIGFKNENLQTLILILLAFVFSVVCRLYWVFWASAFEQYFFNDALMIVSNDGYAFAEGARDMIAGFHQANDLSYYGSSLSTLTYYLYKFTPFSFENIILYMSVFFSSLIVVPIILIAKEYKCLLLGFIAALVASIAKSYYNRTMAGYYDTDMLAIVLPMFILYFMIRILARKDYLSLLFLPFFVAFYLWWYPSSYTLNVALIGLFLIYIFIFERKEKLLYMAVFLSALALSNIAWFYQSAIIILLFALFALKEHYFSFRNICILAVLILVFLAFSGGIDPILYQLKFYIFRSDTSANLAQGFAYFNVNLTIQEVDHIDFETFMQRISSSEFVFLASCLGFVWLIKDHKSMLLSLPMVFLGFLALKGGLRFTIYAVPIWALAFAYFGVKSFEFIKKIQFKTQKTLRKFQILNLILICFLFLLSFLVFYYELNSYGVLQEELGLSQKLDINFFQTFFANTFFMSLLLVFVFLPLVFEFLWRKNTNLAKFCFYLGILLFALFFSFRHIYLYKASSVFNQSEAHLLNELKDIAQREDYVITWWDYGYPVRYYSDVKTLADGGKHLGKDNFFPSFVLSKEQNAAANMARLSVEYTEKSFYTPYDDILKIMMKDYNQSNVDLFLDSLNDRNFKLQGEKTRDIYLYMPTRMALIFPTIASFSYVDLQSGKSQGVFFVPAYYLGKAQGQIYLSNSIVLDDDFRHINIDGRTYTLNTLVEFNSILQNDYKIMSIDEKADLYLFYIKDASVPLQFIIMDKKMYESAFVQMFFFQNYDKNLFELVKNTKDAKIFKLKL